MSLQIEQPSGLSDELTAYLLRMFRAIDTEFSNFGKLPVLKLMPKKPVVGKMYYFSQSIPPEIVSGEGLYIYKTTGWMFIA